MFKYWFHWEQYRATFYLNDVLSFMISRALLVFQGLTGQSENQDPGEVQDLEDSRDHMDHQEFQWVGANYLLFKLTWLRLGLPLNRVKQNVLCRGNIRKMGSSKESFWTTITQTIFPRYWWKLSGRIRCNWFIRSSRGERTKGTLQSIQDSIYPRVLWRAAMWNLNYVSHRVYLAYLVRLGPQD